ncbi:MAG: SpoIIE family protein phosphatase [Campylobacterota bacterium]|nr:SpoIIE family protein phosphatase [Campylobacterota bacterium]
MENNHSSENSMVLIVDDQSFNLDLLEYSLKNQEYTTIIRASSAKSALEIITLNQIDLIISDINMPEMDGLEMLQNIKSDKINQYIPIIMVTAKHEERHKALAYGCEDFLSKPIDPQELNYKVANLLKLKKFNDLQQFFNQKLEEEISRKEKQLKHFSQVEQELKLAKQIQDSILPTHFTTNANLDVFGKCIQASEVGGDFFDIFESNNGEYTNYIMADVSGHGFASALIATQFRSILRCELRNSSSLEQAIYTINNIFTKENNNDSMFVTALFLRYNHNTHTIESINAGHYNPLGNIDMRHKSGIPVGIMPNIHYEVLTTQFNKGDSIILYTDGIVEGEAKDGTMYEDRFYKHYNSLRNLSSKKEVEALLVNYHQFIDKQIDDVTILSIKSL